MKQHPLAGGIEILRLVDEKEIAELQRLNFQRQRLRREMPHHLD